MEDYYEDWKNEQISFQGNLDSFNPEIQKGSRKSLGMDDSRDEYNMYMNIRLDLIKNGAIKDPCIRCKSIQTKYDFYTDFWICHDCFETWNPLRLRFKGI